MHERWKPPLKDNYLPKHQLSESTSLGSVAREGNQALNISTKTRSNPHYIFLLTIDYIINTLKMNYKPADGKS